MLDTVRSVLPNLRCSIKRAPCFPALYLVRETLRAVLRFFGLLGRDLTAQSRNEQLDDLPVRRSQLRRLGGRRRSTGSWLDTLDDVGQLLDRPQFGCGRFVDELLDHQLALGDSAAHAVLGEIHLLVERLVQQGREVLRALWPPFGIAGSAFLKAGMARRLAAADLVITGSVGRRLVFRGDIGVFFI